MKKRQSRIINGRYVDPIAAMDAQGLDVAALSINPYWYHAGYEAAAEVVRIQNKRLLRLVKRRRIVYGLRNGGLPAPGPGGRADRICRT